MGGTYQSIFSDQKLAWRVVKTSPSVRTDVMVGVHLVTTAQQDQVQWFTATLAVDGNRAAVFNGIEAAQAFSILH